MDNNNKEAKVRRTHRRIIDAGPEALGDIVKTHSLVLETIDRDWKVIRRGQTSDKEAKFIKGLTVKCACDLDCYPT